MSALAYFLRGFSAQRVRILVLFFGGKASNLNIDGYTSHVVPMAASGGVLLFAVWMKVYRRSGQRREL
jgi:hypothetical protein